MKTVVRVTPDRDEVAFVLGGILSPEIPETEFSSIVSRAVATLLKKKDFWVSHPTTKNNTILRAAQAGAQQPKEPS